MRGGARLRDALGLLFLLGVLALSYPLLAIFNRPLLVAGVPLLYVYLFAVWAAGIAALALVARRRDDEE
jgi:hypothetical protein